MVAPDTAKQARVENVTDEPEALDREGERRQRGPGQSTFIGKQ